MRLLLVNYEYPPLGGGAGNATRHIARHLAEAGADVVVLTSAFRGLTRRAVEDGFRVLRVPSLRRRLHRSDPLEMSVFMASATVAAIALARDWRPDATLAFFGIPGGPVAWALKRVRGVPYVLSLRGGDVPGSQPELSVHHRLVAPGLRRMWLDAAAVIANSAGQRDLARAAAPDLEIGLVPNGVDRDRFSPGPHAPGSRTGPLRFLFVGRISREKGLDVLLEALAALPPDPAVELTVVGDGPDREALEASARDDGRVRFVGWLPRERLPELYREADALVLPSRSEGMANAALEAMACGLPVVATAVGGNPDLVRAGVSGLLVPPDAPEALAAALACLARDREALARMGARGREIVARDHDWGQVAAAYHALVGRAAAGPAAPEA